MCPPNFLVNMRNKQLGQSQGPQFGQQQVSLDTSAGSTLGDTGADEPIDKRTDLKQARDFVRL